MARIVTRRRLSAVSDTTTAKRRAILDYTMSEQPDTGSWLRVADRIRPVELDWLGRWLEGQQVWRDQSIDRARP